MALPTTLEELMECFREKIHPAETEDKETVDPYYKLAFSASMINHMTVAIDSESKSEFQPLTCTELIKFLLLEFLLRQSQHANPSTAKVQQFSDLPTEVLQILKKLCNFAYTNLLEERYTFELDDFESCEISSPADTLGLIQPVEIPGIFGSKTKYSFLHQCLQEFLAALYLADLPRKQQIAIVGELAYHKPPTFILPAFAGITKLKSRDVLKLLLGLFQQVKYYCANHYLPHLRFKAPGDPQLLLVLLSCICESQRSDLCQVVADRASQVVGSGSLLCFDFRGTQLMPFDCRAVGYFVSKLSHIGMILSFGLCYLSDEDIDIIMKPLLNIRGTNVRINFRFNGNRITHIGTASICKMIRLSSLMCGLSLKVNWIPPQTDISAALKSLTEALSRNMSVSSLNLVGNHITSEHIHYLILMLAFCKNLTSLQLGLNNIASALFLLAASMEQNTSLTTLELQGCCISNEDLLVLGRSLRRNKTLETLDICDNFFTPAALHLFLSLLREGSCIRKLTVSLSHNIDPTCESLLKKINAERVQAGVKPLQIVYRSPDILVQKYIKFTPSADRHAMKTMYASFLAKKQLQLHPENPASTTPTIETQDALLQTLSVELKDVTDWHALGVHLKVPIRELKAIEVNYPQDVQRRKLETLKVWLKREDNNLFNLWKKMVEALRLMDENVIANYLADVYVYNVSDDSG